MMGKQKNRGAASQPDQAEALISNRLLTIPNLLCLIRLAGSFVLVAIAWLNLPETFLYLFLFLAMTDWLDGKLAILLNQRSVFGARLDSWADAALYFALLAGLIRLYGETLYLEIIWVIPALASYLISTAAGFWKYKRWPSYHTLSAKTSWLLTIIAVLGLFTDWSLWPFRIALLVITITNLEAILITSVSPVWRADISSIFHVWRKGSIAQGPQQPD